MRHDNSWGINYNWEVVPSNLLSYAMDSLDCYEDGIVQLAGTYFTWYSCSHGPQNNPGYPFERQQDTTQSFKQNCWIVQCINLLSSNTTIKAKVRIPAYFKQSFHSKMGRKPSRLCAFEILISTLTCLINVVSNKCVGRNFYPKIINMQVLIIVQVQIFCRIT